MLSLYSLNRLLTVIGGAVLTIGLASAQPDSFIVPFGGGPGLNSIRWLSDGTSITSYDLGIYRVRGDVGEMVVTNRLTMRCTALGCSGDAVYHPRPMTAADDGTIWVVDPDLELLQRYDEGSRTLVTINDRIGRPTSLAVGPDGSVYFNDPAGCRVRRSRRGVLSTVAGTGVCGYSNDGGLATEAQILSVRAIALDASGQLFVADEVAGVIRRVDREGVIMTIVGTGIPGVGGESTPANQTPLNGPTALALDARGNLFIAEGKSYRVRMVDADGLIRTVAGTGVVGDGGNGGPAAIAQFLSLSCLAVGTSGALRICDGDRIRQLIPPAPGRWWVPVVTYQVFPIFITDFVKEPHFSPGSWMSILGNFPGVTTTDWSDAIAASGGTLPTSLGGVTAQLDGKPCIIGYVSPNRIDLLLPNDADNPFLEEHRFVLALPGSQISYRLFMSPVSPEFLSISVNNKLYVAALNQEGNLISPRNPTTPGQTVRLYLTGLNIRDLVIPSSDLRQPNGMSFISASGFRILQARPTGPGVFELTVEVPAGVPPGDIPLSLEAGFDPPSGKSVTSRMPIWLPVGAN